MHVLSRAVRIAGVQTLAMRSFRSLAFRRPQRHITPAIAQSCNASWISIVSAVANLGLQTFLFK